MSKYDWPNLIFKIVVAIISILFGVNEYSAHQEHVQLKADVEGLSELYDQKLTEESEVVYGDVHILTQ